MSNRKKKKSSLYTRLVPLAKKVLKIRKRILPGAKLKAEETEFERLYVGEDAKKAQESEQERNTLIALFIAFAGMALVMIYLLKGNTGGREAVSELSRPSFGTARNDLFFDATSQDERLEGLEMGVDIESLRLEGEEREALLERAADYVEDEIFRANESRDCVRNDLNLVDQVPGTDVTVSYPDLDMKLVRYDGTLKNKELEGPEKTVLKVVLEYFGYEVERKYDLTVFPPVLTAEEELKKEALRDLEDRSGDYSETAVSLPGSSGGYELSWYRRGESPLPLILLVIIVVFLLPFVFKKDRENRIKKRKDQMKRDYAQVVGKLSLLLSAGMTVRGAWDKVCDDYVKFIRPRQRHFAYEEMMITSNEMKLGKSQTTAIEQFGRRCDLKEYRKLCKIITSNLKHGSKGLIPLLGAEADESLEGLKEYAKQKGEEAGTKLLAPMIIMLVIVMAIVMVPALMSFGPL
ncbi:MAG: type II secretion system F family protein [Lachnospiraceae bacterium]|nr:type II secretion system F family protein [Lachnospiraceae bacterium]